MQTESNAKCWVGIDVSQKWVDIEVGVDEQAVEQFRCDRTVEALTELAQRLLPYRPQGVVLEATGGLEECVIAALAVVDLRVMRMNPKRVRDFARAHGMLAKTDVLDAHILALFGARMRPEWRGPLQPERQKLAAFVARLQQITLQRAGDRTRLKQTTEAELRSSIQRCIAFLGTELARVEKQVTAWIAKSATWKPQEALLRSVPGVGPKTARVLLAKMPELGHLNRREIAALAGLAPFASDSGQWRGKRHIQGGRSSVRAALYLATWTAIRLPGSSREFYQRLVASGKPKQVALIAVARKLLLVLNEMMRTGKPWRSANQPVSA